MKTQVNLKTFLTQSRPQRVILDGEFQGQTEQDNMKYFLCKHHLLSLPKMFSFQFPETRVSFLAIQCYVNISVCVGSIHVSS